MLIYKRPRDTELEKLLCDHLLLIKKRIQEGNYTYTRCEEHISEENEISTVTVQLKGLPPLNFRFLDGSEAQDETKLKELVEHEFYIQELLRLSITLPKEYRTFDHSFEQINSAISRCIERDYPNSLQALCEFAHKTGLKPTNLYLLPKYLPFNPNTYAIAASYGYHDLCYEGQEDFTPIDGSKHYVGYRLSSHTFHYMQPSRVQDMLNYWLKKMTYKNCTVEAVMGNNKNQVRTVAKLLQHIPNVVPEKTLTPNQFIRTYWEKGYVIEDWMYITGM